MLDPKTGRRYYVFTQAQDLDRLGGIDASVKNFAMCLDQHQFSSSDTSQNKAWTRKVRSVEMKTSSGRNGKLLNIPVLRTVL